MCKLHIGILLAIQALWNLEHLFPIPPNQEDRSGKSVVVCFRSVHAPGMFAYRTRHDNDYEALLDANTVVRIQARQHGPPELLPLDNKMVNFLRVERNNQQPPIGSWIIVEGTPFPRNTCQPDGTYALGFGLANLKLPTQSQRRTGSLYNGSPLDKYARSQHARVASRQQSLAPPTFFDTFAYR